MYCWLAPISYAICSFSAVTNLLCVMAPPAGGRAGNLPATMARVRAIHVSAVKSLHLTEVDEAFVGLHGVTYDRRFLLVYDDGSLATQRKVRVLAQVRSGYDAGTGVLELRLPGGEVVRDVPRPVGRTSVDLWGREAV